MKRRNLFNILATILILGITIIGCASGVSAVSAGSGTPITVSGLAGDLVGNWELYQAVNISRASLIQRLELFGHGSGILYFSNEAVVLVTWRIRQGNRLQFQSDMYRFRESDDIELSEDGMFLTFYYDGRDFAGANPRRGIYRREVEE